jgi:hypothetical protein
MRIPPDFEILPNSKYFEEWLKRKDTDEVLSEIQHAIGIHCGLYVTDYSGLFPSYYVHPLVKVVYSYWVSLHS